MSDVLTCAETRDGFALLLYGELSFDEEERIETHLDTCAECRAALQRERALHAAFDSVEIQPSPSLLRECRADLAERLQAESMPAQPPGWWDQFVAAITGPLVLRPAGALALVALGFFGARIAPSLSAGPAGIADVAEAGMARVRDVRPGKDGDVRIVLDETRQKTVSGDFDDSGIRDLLLEAMRDPSDPGLRADSVDILNSHLQNTHAQFNDVRDALIYSLRHDPNAGIRLKAMDGLRAFPRDPEVRGAVAAALLGDASAGVRAQAIDLLLEGVENPEQGPSLGLTSGLNPSGGLNPVGDNLDRQVIGTLQQMMLHEQNSALRARCQRVLESLNASTEIY